MKIEEPPSLARLCLEVLANSFEKLVLLDEHAYHWRKSKENRAAPTNTCWSDSEEGSDGEHGQLSCQSHLPAVEDTAEALERISHDWSLLPGQQKGEIVCSVTRRTQGSNLQAWSAARSLSMSMLADASSVDLQGCTSVAVETYLLHAEHNVPIQTLKLSNTGTSPAILVDASCHLASLTELDLAGAPRPAPSDSTCVNEYIRLSS
jgi:hypothetical protein